MITLSIRKQTRKKFKELLQENEELREANRKLTEENEKLKTWMKGDKND